MAYLKKTGVYELVQESLKLTALQRPADPVRFLADYLQTKAPFYKDDSQRTIQASSVTQEDLRPRNANENSRPQAQGSLEDLAAL